jgi:hypothetical protein
VNQGSSSHLKLLTVTAQVVGQIDRQIHLLKKPKTLEARPPHIKYLLKPPFNVLNFQFGSF